jgi:hypothetical protein
MEIKVRSHLQSKYGATWEEETYPFLREKGEKTNLIVGPRCRSLDPI